MIIINTDGGSRGNPGPAAYGVSIAKEGKEIEGFGKTLGVTTNNVAEYTAVIEALNWLISHRELIGDNSGIKFQMDSQLVCRQLNGQYKVKNAGMQSLFFTVKKKEQELGLPISYYHVPREQNKRADYFVNKALDNL